MTDPTIWVALAAVVVGCYFATLSAALRSFSKAKLTDLLEDRGQSQRLDPFMRKISKMTLMCSTLRMAMTLVVLLCMVELFIELAQPWSRYLAAFVVACTVTSVFGVALPMSLARYHPAGLLARSIPLMHVCLFVFKPLANVLYLFDPIVRRMLGSPQQQTSGEDLLTEEILSVVEDHEDRADVDETQKDMLEGVIELRSTTTGQVMTPRTDVKGIEVGATLDEVKQKILQWRHSRIPVYRNNLDTIEGVLYAKDMIRFVGNGEPWDIKSVIRQAFMVPESKSVNELLAEFKARKVHMAIVLDEYGGTAGLVTIEDILEEIVGEIHDEYEPGEDDPAIHRTGDATAQVDARVRVNDLNDEFDLQWPEDEDYDTVGGFVFARLGHIPEVGESFDYENLRVTVTSAERTRVTSVQIEILESHAGAEGG